MKVKNAGNAQEKSKQEGAKEKQNEKLKSEELVAQLQRLQAEFENYKKRTEREFAAYKEVAMGACISALLPVIDNLELALKNATKEEKDGFYKGIELVYAQFLSILHELGVEEIKTEGRFDPRLHEALLAEAHEGSEKNTILEVLQKGYRLKDRVLRTAKVKVAK